MATTAPNKDAVKAAKLREMAKDKTLPQPVRNQYLDDANMLEEKAAKGAGVKLAKGGAVVAKAPKKMMYGGAVAKMAVGGVVPQTAQQQQVMPRPRVAPIATPKPANPRIQQQALAQKQQAMARQVMPRQRVAPIATPKLDLTSGGGINPVISTPSISRATPLDLTSGGGINPVISTPSISRATFAPQQNAMAQQQATAGPAQPMMAKGGAVKKSAVKKPMMAKGGVVAKAPMKKPAEKKPMMAKGGSVAKKAKK